MTLNHLTAFALAIASITIGIRQVLLSNQSPLWPCAPRSVQTMMFFVSVTLAGLAALFGWHHGVYAGQAAGPVAFTATVIALYSCVLLFNVLGQRLPARTWTRLNRITEQAHHPHGQWRAHT